MPSTPLLKVAFTDPTMQAILNFVELPGVCGPGDHAYTCPGCGQVMMRNYTHPRGIGAVVYRCPICKTLGAMPGIDHGT